MLRIGRLRFVCVVVVLLSVAFLAGCNDADTGDRSPDWDGQADGFIERVSGKTYTLTTKVSPSGSGSVSRSPDKRSYTYGERVTITAVPDDGYLFDSWTIGGNGIIANMNDASTSILIKDNVTMTVSFIQIGVIVEIGNQIWTAENMNHEPSSGNSWCYDNDDSYCDKYGRLYDWEAAMSVCPNGWRLPSRGDWDILAEFVGGVRPDYYYDEDLHVWLYVGSKLKAKNGWNINVNGIGNGTDDYGFAALPGGDYYYGYFGGVGSESCWWTATESANGAYIRYMGLWDGYEDTMLEFIDENVYGSYVRCVRDK